MIQNAQRTENFRCWVCGFSAFLGLFLMCGVGFAQSQVPADDADQPLRSRVSGFWQAMKDADYDKATTFVVDESKKAFARLPKNRVLKFKIDKLSYNADKTECDTLTIVTKPTPSFGQVLDWPLQNQWVLRNGEWFLKIPWGENDNPMLSAFKSQEEMIAKTTERKPPPPKPADLKVKVERLQRLRAMEGNPATVHFGDKATLRFEYYNSGNAPFRVLSAHADCHCTALKEDFPWIQPGESGTLEVVLDSFGLPLGLIEKKVTVEFSDLSEPITLSIRVQSVPNYRVEPQMLDFGSLRVGASVEREVHITNESGREVRILRISNSDPRLTFSADKKVLAPGESMLIQVQYNPAIAGEFIDVLMLQTDLPAESIANIRVRGTATP